MDMKPEDELEKKNEEYDETSAGLPLDSNFGIDASIDLEGLEVKNKDTTTCQEAFTFYSNKLDYQIVETKTGTDYYIAGYISTPDLDLVNDIVTKDCQTDMRKQLIGRNIKLDLEHETLRKGKEDTETDVAFNKTKRVLGKFIDTKLDTKGLWAKVKLNKNYPDFKGIWEDIKTGFYDAFSIAFIPVKTAFKTLKDGTKSRLLIKVNLLNVALTGNPINPEARRTDVFTKSLEDHSIKSQDTNTKEVKTMTDETIEEQPKVEDAPKEDAPAEEKKEDAPEDAPKTDAPAEDAPKEDAPKKEADDKKEDAVEKPLEEVKDLIKENGKLEQRIDQLEKIVSNPQVKALLEKKPEDVEKKSVTPLGQVGRI